MVYWVALQMNAWVYAVPSLVRGNVMGCRETAVVLAALIGCQSSNTGSISVAPARNIPKGESQWSGRWVFAEVKTMNRSVAILAAAYHFWQDSVELLVYPPRLEAPTSWRVRGDSVEIDDNGSRESDHFSIRGDTLELEMGRRRPTLFRRLSGTGEAGLRGSWRTTQSSSTIVITFRSDGLLIAEMGTGPQPSLRGDTLESSVGGRSVRSVLRRKGNVLYVEVEGQQRQFLRRPWGCFGVKELDRAAKECQ